MRISRTLTAAAILAALEVTTAAGEALDRVFSEVASGTLSISEAKVLTDFALSPDGDIFAVDPRSRAVWRLHEGKVVSRFGIDETGRKIFRQPWHVRWSPRGLYVLDRDQDSPAVFLLDDRTGRVLKKLDLSASPAIVDLPERRILLGFRHLFETGNMDVLHVYSDAGKHEASFFPNDPRDQEDSPFSASNANELVFDADRDGNVFASQAFLQRIDVFSAHGAPLRRIQAACRSRRRPDFAVAPPRANAQAFWDNWRNSWSRIVALRVVGSWVATQTIDTDGKPGWVDVYDKQGNVIIDCAPSTGWLQDSQHDRLLFVEPVADRPGARRYRILQARASKRPQASSLLNVPLEDSNGRSQVLAKLLNRPSTLLVLVHPDVCGACLTEVEQWRSIAARDCKQLGLFSIAVGVVDVADVWEMARELSLPFPTLWDRNDQLRGLFRSNPDAALPYKVMLAADGSVRGHWGGTGIWDEQEAIRAAILNRAGCDDSISLPREK